LIAQATYTPAVDETATTLLHELSHIGASLASHSLEIIEQEVVNTRVQESAEITYAPKIEPADLVLQWNQSAIALERKVRALLDKPLAFTTFRGKRIQMGRLRISDQVVDVAPGTLISEGEDLYVATGSVLVRLTTVKPEGKSWMDASAWWRGIQDRENANFT
jgi:methionyl-tRNA formyltransferase